MALYYNRCQCLSLLYSGYYGEVADERSHMILPPKSPSLTYFMCLGDGCADQPLPLFIRRAIYLFASKNSSNHVTSILPLT